MAKYINKMVIKEYFGQLYTHKFNTLHETVQFTERNKILQTTQKINNLNWVVSNKEIVSTINKHISSPSLTSRQLLTERKKKKIYIYIKKSLQHSTILKLM